MYGGQRLYQPLNRDDAVYGGPTLLTRLYQPLNRDDAVYGGPNIVDTSLSTSQP